MGVHTPTVGFYKMAAHTFRYVDVKCAVGMGLQESGSIVMYVARDGFYKMGAGNFHDQLIPNQPQEKSSIKWHWVLRGGSIYKMGSTKWGGPTPPTLKTRWISILFCARPHPFCRGNWRGDSYNMKWWAGFCLSTLWLHRQVSHILLSSSVQSKYSIPPKTGLSL